MLVRKQTALTDPVVETDHCVPHGQHRHHQDILRRAVALVHHAHAVGLQDAVIFEGGGAGQQVRFVALGQLHGNAQGNKAEFPGLHVHRFGGAQINPVSLGQLFQRG